MSKTNKKDIKKNQMELLGMKNKCLKLKKKKTWKDLITDWTMQKNRPVNLKI